MQLEPGESNERDQPEELSAAPSGEARPQHSARFERLRKVTDRLAWRLDPKRSPHEGGFSTGEVAELRRIDVAREGVASAGPTFWRIVIDDLESDSEALLPAYAEGEPLKKWLAILQTWAKLAGLHRASRPLGGALYHSNVSEMRLTRLLRARDEELYDQLRKAAHQLHSAAASVDFVDIAQFVLNAGTPYGETVRRRIASSYYRAERKQESNQNAE